MSKITNNKTTNSNTIQTFWVAIGSFSSFLLAIVSSAILSRYFDKSNYGTYKQIIYIYTTLLVVFSAGLPKVYSYFLPRYTLSEGKDLVWKLTKLLLILGMSFSISLFLLSGIIANVLNNPDLEQGLKIFSPIPFFLLPTLGIEGIMSTYKKNMFLAIYNVISRLLMLVFIIGAVILVKGTYTSAIWGWMIAAIFTFISAMYFKNIPFKGIVKTKVDLSYSEIFKYSLPLVVASIAGVAIRSADQFYISRYFGEEIFAEFSNGFIQLPFVGMVTVSAGVVLMPIFSKIVYEDKELNGLILTWRNTLIKSAIIIYPIVLFFIFNAKSFIVLLYSSKYVNSTIYFQIILILNLFNIIVFAPLIFAFGKTKFYATLHIIFAIVIWILDYYLVIYFHTPIIIAISSVVISILIILILLIYSSKLLNVSTFKLVPFKHIFAIFLHSSIMGIISKTSISYFFPKLNNVLSIGMIGILFLILLISTSFIVKIDYLSVIKPLVKFFK